ncbi:MAG: hypothetical protein V4629_09970 [Pseudomonadota bacterium]
MLLIMIGILSMKMATTEYDDLNITGNVQKKEDVALLAQLALQTVAEDFVEMTTHPKEISHFSGVFLNNNEYEIWPDGLGNLSGSKYYNSAFSWWDQSLEWWETYGEPVEFSTSLKNFYKDYPTPRVIIENKKHINAVDPTSTENVYYYRITVLALLNDARSVKQIVFMKEY